MMVKLESPFSSHPSPVCFQCGKWRLSRKQSCEQPFSFQLGLSSSSVVQEGCKAGFLKSCLLWIHTVITRYLLSGRVQLLVTFWSCPWKTSCVDTYEKHTLQNVPWKNFKSKHLPLVLAKVEVKSCMVFPLSWHTWCSREMEKKLLSALLQLLVCRC